MTRPITSDPPRTAPVSVALPTGGVAVFHSSHGQGFTMPEAKHSYAEIIFVEWGRGRVEIAGATHRVTPRSWIFTVPGQPHRFLDDPEDPLSLITLCFDPELWNSHPSMTGLRRPFWERAGETPVFRLPDPFQTARLEEWVRQALFAGGRRDNAQAPRLGALTTLVAAELLSEAPAPLEDPLGREEALIKRCENWLEGHFTEKLSVADLAELSGLSYRRFTHLFKKVTGETAHRRIENLRLDYACRQLLATGNIMHSSLHAGFEDITTFYRAFKKKTKMTPRQYLESNGRKAHG